MSVWYVMCGQTGSKYIYVYMYVYVYNVLKSRFNLTTINPLEPAGLGKILHIFATSMGALEMLPSIS